MFRHFLKILIFLFLPFKLIQSQSTYYVSTNGNDNNNGLTTGTSFATLQHAADIVFAGDSVLVLEGNYVGFDIRTNGNQNNSIVFKVFEANVIIDQRNAVTPDGINIENASWIVIDGFEVKNQPRAGIRAAVSDFITIKNNYCHNNFRWGIFTGFTDDLTVENNTCSFSENEHGIYVSNSSDRPMIRNNHSHNNNGCGIHMNGDISMGGDGIISNAIVEGNIIHDNGVGGGSAINMDGVQDSKIFNNLIYNNHATGIAMFQIDGGDASKNNKVYNNTIIQPSNGRWCIISVDGSTGNTLYNNIFINHHSFRGSIALDAASRTGFISDYNILVNRLSDDDGGSNMTLTQWQSLGYDQHSQIANPENQIFVDNSNGNFHLLQNSQAVNSGTNLVLPTVFEDLDNVSRPQGSGFDIGSYEFVSTTSVEAENIPQSFQLFQNYPNPFNPSTKIRYNIPSVISTPDRIGINSERNLNTMLKVFDVLGKEIITLVDEEKSAGNYEVNFNASFLPSGIYFFQLKAGSFIQTKKMILLR
ncbi:MAG: right-handed parallel beta-helix repeat-containing protein [Ignavibacteriaceae bacterium]|nr:right-handed parallel beta-helix repeat-containing protein [Ignavibacterium sp.]MCC6254034.1 right-handed parallel beta-helix repeat-containing protein [Ignavibacteriaceae bacterium]HRN27287.1 right-handed parallel beta-helix repeat-containing protein [Ignavibacteriaceae bacterium]HRP92233.1 right-handed parallel beta-helix repeat-containing protein [Ignavibacteriaceae bacterium]HRQ54923.1 right-handed parallel beta-helix repeat-containing protein [Ignavibacteriaceae bacterium]